MNILACGDVSSKSGRAALKLHLAKLITNHKIDLSIVNVDNAAHGLGVTSEKFREIIAYGADVCTGGNHLFDKQEILDTLKNDSRLIRPYNYSKYTPGVGLVKIHKNGKDFLVIHMAGQKSMKENADNAFLAMDDILSKYKLGQNIDAILVDFHAEVTSEKVAFANYLDGRVSFIFGTHTHIPTADLRILKNGTAYITDLGMTGDYDTVIGMKKEAAIGTFINQGSTERLTPTFCEGTLCGAIVQLDGHGLAKTVRQIRLGGDSNWRTSRA